MAMRSNRVVRQLQQRLSGDYVPVPGEATVLAELESRLSRLKSLGIEFNSVDLSEHARQTLASSPVLLTGVA